MNNEIEEMAMVVCSNCVVSKRCRFYKKPCSAIKAECEALYNAGYRKQSEGEWVIEGVYFKTMHCSVCNHTANSIFEKTLYCPNCGSKMKGE